MFLKPHISIRMENEVNKIITETNMSIVEYMNKSAEET